MFFKISRLLKNSKLLENFTIFFFRVSNVIIPLLNTILFINFSSSIFGLVATDFQFQV